MSVNVTSTINLNVGIIEQLSGCVQEALLKTAEALHTEIGQEEVIPMQTGLLSGEAFFVDDSNIGKNRVALINNTPYARRLYYHPEYHFSKEFHSNAKGEWYKDWLPGGRYAEFIPETFAEFMRERMG